MGAIAYYNAAAAEEAAHHDLGLPAPRALVFNPRMGPAVIPLARL
jgi:hypothetical protein